MWHDATAQAPEEPETSVSGLPTPPRDLVESDEALAVRLRDEAFAEVAKLTAEIIRHTRQSQILAADSLVEKAIADAAAVRRSFVVIEAIEAAGYSTATHTLTVDRGKVEVVPLEVKK